MKKNEKIFLLVVMLFIIFTTICFNFKINIGIGTIRTSFFFFKNGIHRNTAIKIQIIEHCYPVLDGNYQYDDSYCCYIDLEKKTLYNVYNDYNPWILVKHIFRW